MKNLMLILIAILAMSGVAFADSSDSASTATSTAGSAINGDVNPSQNLSIVNEGTDLSKGRGFAVPGDVVFPGTPGYFGVATPSQEFMPISKMLMYDKVFDVRYANHMIKDVFMPETAFTVKLNIMRVSTKLTVKDTVTLDTTGPMAGKTVKQIGLGTIAANRDNITSAALLAMVVVEAHKNGANYVQFLAEGVNRKVNASGWGIGLHHTGAQVSGSDNDRSNVTSGGLGYSKGQAGTTDRPWVQFVLLKVSE